MSNIELRKDVRKLIDFIVKSQKIGDVWRFKQLEEELEIPKSKIIEIFDLFRKANLFNYSIIAWDPGEEDYDIEPTREMIDKRTGGFVVGKADIPSLIDISNSYRKIDRFLSTFHSFKEKPELVGGHIVWGNTKISVGGGYRSMMAILLESPREILNKKVVKEGVSINRIILEEAGPYKSEVAFRNALKKLRAKLKVGRLPIKIKRPKKNHYILEVEKICP